MYKKTRWNSQPLDIWRAKYAKGKFIDLEGHPTHYMEKGDGPPVILIHGWFHDSQMWNKNVDILANRFRVYAVDLWGFGYSTRAAMDWGYPLYADQLIKFMNALDIRKASLVGQSMGAGASILFCVKHQERVDKLVLVSPAGLPNPSPFIDEAVMQRCLKELLLNRDGSRGLMLKTMFIYDEKSIADGYFDELTRFHKIEGTNEVLVGSLRNDFFDRLLFEIDRLGKIDVPILIIWGRHDKSVNLELGEKMHSMLKGSRLEIIEDSAHCANYEQPDKFNETVMRFLWGEDHESERLLHNSRRK